MQIPLHVSGCPLNFHLEDDADPPPRQRLSIELPSLFNTPPAAQRQRLRIPLHNIGPIYLIVEEGFVPRDFYQFGGLDVWQHEGQWHAYARESLRVQTDDRHPLTDDEDGMEEIRGGGRSLNPEPFAHTFVTHGSSAAWLLRGGGGSGDSDEDEEPAPDQYKQALEKLKSSLVVSNLPLLRMLLRGNASLVRRVNKAGNGQQQLQLISSAAQRVRIEAPVSSVILTAAKPGGSKGNAAQRPGRGRSVEIRTPQEESSKPNRRVVGKQPPPPEQPKQEDPGKAKKFGWVAPTPKPASETSYDLIPTEWSVPPTPRLVAGRPGIAMLAEKEDALCQAKAMKGGQVPMAILVRAKYEELEAFTAQWVAFSAMRKKGEAEAEKVALKGWLIQIGKGAVDLRQAAAVPITVTSTDRTTTMAVDLHQSYTDNKVWEVVVGQHRLRVMRKLIGALLRKEGNKEEHCKKILQDATTPGRSMEDDDSNCVTGCFRLSKAGQKAIRVPSSIVEELVEQSGVMGIFLRPLDSWQEQFRVIWLSRDTSEMKVAQDLQADVGALGLALSASGTLGLRVATSNWDAANHKLGRPQRDPVYRVCGFPKDTSADMVEDLITGMQWNASLVPGGWRFDGKEGSWLLRSRQPPSALVQKVRWGEAEEEYTLILQADKKPARSRPPQVKVWSRLSSMEASSKDCSWEAQAPIGRSRSVRLLPRRPILELQREQRRRRAGAARQGDTKKAQ